MRKYQYLHRQLILGIVSLIVFGSCSKSSITKNPINSLSGEYEIVKATSSEMIDINLDGVSSSDLLTEMPVLKNSHLKLISKGESSGVYSQFWQNQFFQGTEQRPPLDYDPSIIVGYLNQATVADFTVKDKMLMLSRSWSEPTFPLPNSVESIDKTHIAIKMDKAIYTKSGLTNIKVDALYKKKNN